MRGGGRKNKVELFSLGVRFLIASGVRLFLRGRVRRLVGGELWISLLGGAGLGLCDTDTGWLPILLVTLTPHQLQSTIVFGGLHRSSLS